MSEDPQSMLKLSERLGFSAAAVYAPLYDHYRKQRRRQRHFHDGRYWVRMPYDDFPRMFPDLPATIVSNAIGRLEDKGLLRMVHYGPLSWYTMDRISRRVV
jgi:hypothetical protein